MCREAALTAPLILGAGPAGCAAAIVLARGGAEPVLIDRDERVGDALCGGFMSWRTAESLRGLGIDLPALGAHRVGRLRLFAGERQAEARLPATAFGLSRHAFDTALRQMALASGARLKIDRARGVAPGRIEGARREWRSDAIFLATGKHDVRGESRPRQGDDPALGLRIRLPGGKRLHDLLAGAIELHFFDGGYAGIVLQEDGSANVCLAVRKSLLAGAGGDPRTLLDRLAADYPAFAERMAGAPAGLPIDTIGSVPYGWIATETQPGLYRLGDQAAVIPSLAGEGMSIAIASGIAAGEAYLSGRSAPQFQRGFARRSRRPVGAASLVWHLAENPTGALALATMAKLLPASAGLAMRLSRID
ncbi:NAD(P)/FAD-dependent oxidoreductase [Erythrobacter sp. 3-20A1M]|uniref:NAD(P)/FAD-dependent oxidoreductase n=1 Tax=Erythrobacter sp. 3-20A1M TaxID=2653850 RepID=UPI00203A6A8A|nr:FAD-dependent monooxygenase [Erythrobacter sp. 3-20A1M]